MTSTEISQLCHNLSVNTDGHLLFAGQDTADLAKRYGTPLYLMDEDRIRENCRTYLKAFRECFPVGSLPLFASKACSFTQIYRIMKNEGMGIDVVSCGEIASAVRAGFDLKKAFFHGNNKTEEDIAFALDQGIGYFVADGADEVLALEAEAARRGICQKLLLRVTPGIDPHTYAAVATGQVDSKFGSAVETGQAEEVTALIFSCPHLKLAGFHCHVGSQVFAEDVFERTARIMLGFIAEIRRKYGYLPEYLNLGGGYGVRYVLSDGFVDIAARIREVALAIGQCCEELELPVPKILMEPGRSIVADAGLTLYTAGSLKKIPGCKNYVSVDGGMTDNPRFALYGSRYTVLAAGKMNETCDFEASVVGRCCESGDILQEHVKLPSSIARGDLLAVCTTGAYNYSMASNYNRVPRPPIVLLKKEGETFSSYVAVRRETREDLLNLDI